MMLSIKIQNGTQIHDGREQGDGSPNLGGIFFKGPKKKKKKVAEKKNAAQK
jgi:hypothetical protein